MSYLSQNKNTDNFLEALLRNHQHYLPIIEFLDSAIHNAAELSWADCEEIGLELGKQNGSAFCAGIRTGMIKALGTTPDKADKDKLQPILEYAQKLNKNSSSITEADIQTIRDKGWNDQTVEDVTGLVAIFKVYSILANGLGFKSLPEAAFAEMGTGTVGMKGYTPVFRHFIEQSATG